jgi:tRNA pseudouridine32 synthase/23S rRNA pseudouridine746 synthase
MRTIEDRVLFIDAEAIVLDKPAGLAVHPGPSTRHSLEDRLGELRFGFARAPAPVHRLDRDTSGCLLLARNPKAHKRFARAFEAGEAAKVYVAVLDGVPKTDAGTVDLPLAKRSSREQGWRIVADPAGKPAVTDWRVLARASGRALVRFAPRTGRTHQIRVHAASGLGLPISGDPVYGHPSPGLPRAGGRLNGGGEGIAGGAMLLHALALEVPRPPKPAVSARAPLPASFVEAGFSEADVADA